MLKKILATFMVGGLLFAGCASKEVAVAAQPIDPSLDICAACKMSIVDLHFAAELIDDKRQALKFDDIGCMISYLKKHSDVKDSAKASYVCDYESQEWLEVDQAHFFKGRVDTPMSSGIVAFGKPEKAQRLAERIQGSLLNWEQVQAAHKPKAKQLQEGSQLSGGMKSE